MRKIEHEFVSTDSEALLSYLIGKFEEQTGRALKPADPERLVISWVADFLIAERVHINHIGNQNLPSRAIGENLDALGELLYGIERRAALPAKTDIKFTITQAQPTATVIPKGTRITDRAQSVVWATSEDGLIPIGETSIVIPAECQVVGVVGNGFTASQINTLVDVDSVPYYSHCEGVTTSWGGADRETDDEYYERMRLSLSKYSTAGSAASYEYWAKSVSPDIIDVKVFHNYRGSEQYIAELSEYQGSGPLDIYFDSALGDLLLYITTKPQNVDYPEGGRLVKDTHYTVVNSVGAGVSKCSIPQEIAAEIKRNHPYLRLEGGKHTAGNVTICYLKREGVETNFNSEIAEACNAEFVRPLTDFLFVSHARAVEYSIEATYYLGRNSEKSLTQIQEDINRAIENYKQWQGSKIGRDINPSKLHQLLMETGVKRVEITSPIFTQIDSNEDWAKCINVSLTNGGFEDG